MHMYIRTVQYVRSRCMPFSSAGGGSMDMEEWHAGEGRHIGLLEGKGPRYLAVQPNTTCTEEKGEREILERRSSNLVCYKAEYARFSYCFPVKYSTRSAHCAQMKISPGRKVTPSKHRKEAFRLWQVKRPFCCSNDRQKKE